MEFEIIFDLKPIELLLFKCEWTWCNGKKCNEKVVGSYLYGIMSGTYCLEHLSMCVNVPDMRFEDQVHLRTVEYDPDLERRRRRNSST